MIRAVLWDFGGVILTSPFDAFARYESERGLPAGFVRRVNSENVHTNAWARLERNELSAVGFDIAFAAESAALGHRVAGRDVLGVLVGDVRPQMVRAIDIVAAAGLRNACLTNNVVEGGWSTQRPDVADVMARFDVIVESSRVGVRKPEPAFYELACAMLAIDPASCVFLDDLGINLKPARALGMATIKVGDPDVALTDLGRLLGVELTPQSSVTTTPST